MRREGLFVHAWVTNVDKDIPPWIVENHEAFDICAVEAYTYKDNKFYWRRLTSYIENIRKRGMERKALVGLLAGDDHSRLGLVIPSEDLLRRQIAKIRDELPESPGVAFWAAYLPKWVIENQPYFTKVVREFYHDPAPTVAITNLSPRQSVNGTIDVRVEATPGRSGRQIAYYRYFIDNVMVAESSHSVFRWDTAVDGAGSHTFAVHAVNSVHLAGAAQVDVEVTGA